MNMQAQHTKPASAHEVDVSAIERDLMRYLRAPENSSESGVPGTRTAVFNLVAFASDRPTMQRITDALAALIDHHPSRTIVALVDPTIEDPPIHAWVQVQCKPLGTTGMHVCVDQIIIESKPTVRRRIPNLVLPLLLADLPAIVWWPGEPPMRDPFLYDMLEPANRLVVDTSEFIHVERALLELNTLRYRPGLSVDLADLNWARILPWRELIAQLWDVSDWHPHLHKITKVEIDLGRPTGGRSNRPQALLLAGWLASRLKWEPMSLERMPDGYRMQAKHGRQRIEILVHINVDKRSGVRAVRLHAESARSTSIFSVTASLNDTASTTVERRGVAESVTRVSRLEEFSEHECLAQELDSTVDDRIFDEALAGAVGFLRAGAPTSKPKPAKS